MRTTRKMQETGNRKQEGRGSMVVVVVVVVEVVVVVVVATAAVATFGPGWIAACMYAP